MKRSPCSSSSQGEVRDSTPKRIRPADVPPVVAPIQDLGEEARCHRVVLETHPIAKTELVAHLDRLWLDCGAEYQFLHSASDPFEMPLLRFPPRDRPDRTFHPLLSIEALRTVKDQVFMSQLLRLSTSLLLPSLQQLRYQNTWVLWQEEAHTGKTFFLLRMSLYNLDFPIVLLRPSPPHLTDRPVRVRDSISLQVDYVHC